MVAEEPEEEYGEEEKLPGEDKKEEVEHGEEEKVEEDKKEEEV